MKKQINRIRMDGIWVLVLKVKPGEGILMVDDKPNYNIRVSSELI